MDIILFFLTIFCTFGSLIAVFCLTPYFTPDDICFGIPIPKDAVRSEKVVKLKKNFITFCAVSGIAFALTASAIRTYSGIFVCLFAFCLFSLLQYLVCARAVKSMQFEQDVIRKSEIYINKPVKFKGFSVWWELILAVFPLSFAVISYIFKFSYAVALFSAGAFAAVFIIHLLIARFPLFAGENRTMEKSQKIRRRWSCICFLFGVLVQLAAVIIFLPTFNVPINHNIIQALPFVLAIAVVVVAIISGLKK